jgi:hypothetical protein
MYAIHAASPDLLAGTAPTNNPATQNAVMDSLKRHLQHRGAAGAERQAAKLAASPLAAAVVDTDISQ